MDKVWTITSKDSGKEYTVRISEAKKSCTCPHWQYRLRNYKAKCKHIEEVERLIKVQEWADSLPIDQWLFDFGPFETTKPDDEEIA